MIAWKFSLTALHLTLQTSTQLVGKHLNIILKKNNNKLILQTLMKRWVTCPRWWDQLSQMMGPIALMLGWLHSNSTLTTYLMHSRSSVLEGRSNSSTSRRILFSFKKTAHLRILLKSPTNIFATTCGIFSYSQL